MSQNQISFIQYLSDQVIQEFKEAFSLFDKDSDGAISTNELGRVMQQLGQNPTEDELKELIEEVDQDGNGEVDFEEFLNLMAKRMRESDSEEELTNSFKFFDTNQDGFITKDELRLGMIKLGSELQDEEINELFREADLDDDDQLNYEEFIRFMYPK